MGSLQTSEPLLYIEQPTMKQPQAKMQAVFHEKISSAYGKKQDKRFKNCTIEEKIQYLLHLPKGLLRVKCEVVTEETTYLGMLVKENKGYIVVENFGRGEQHILKSAITDIRLISL